MLAKSVLKEANGDVVCQPSRVPAADELLRLQDVQGDGGHADGRAADLELLHGSERAMLLGGLMEDGPEGKL
jgi:hypothetical protein